MDYMSFAIVLAAIVGYWLLMYLFKANLANGIAKAMEKGEYATYQKLLFSKRAVLLLNGNSVYLMRANFYIVLNDWDNSEKCLKMVSPRKLPMQEALHYYQAMISLSFIKKDTDLFDKMTQDLVSIKNSKNEKMIDDIILQNNMNKKLHLEFDATVITDLLDMLEGSEGVQSGMLLLSLAKAYHINHQEEKALETLQKASGLLKGTMYEEAVQSAMQDVSALD